MTAERYRAPLSQGAPANGYSLSRGAHELDLFGLGDAADSTPHPDFLARASIWRDHAAGLISRAEASRRSAAIGMRSQSEGKPSRAQVQARAVRTSTPPRHARLSPNESRQYAVDMATTAARDDRLTPNAKAFLQVLRARCGKGRETTITKGTMGAVMSRSARTIRRYLVDLVRFGYVELETRRNARGLHLGLTVRITEKVLPFFEEAKGLARWLAETPKTAFLPFSGAVLSGNTGVTLLTPKNQTINHLSYTALKTGRKTAWKITKGKPLASA